MKSPTVNTASKYEFIKIGLLIVVLALALYAIFDLLISPQIKKFMNSKFPEIAATENAVHSVYPDRPVGISVNKKLGSSSNGNANVETVTVDIQGDPKLTQAELQNLKTPICSALSKKDGNYTVAVRNLKTGGFLFFSYSVSSTPITFTCS